MAFRDSKKKKYNLKPKAGELPLGSKGIIVSYAVGSYRKDAIREILNILSLQNLEDVKEFQDLESGIKRAREEIRRFVPMLELTRGLTFIEFKYKEDLPNIIVKNIFENASKCSCRFISNIIPIQIICSAKINVLAATLKNFVAQEFPYSNAAKKKDKMHGQKSTWALMYKRTHSNEANKELVLSLLDEFIGDSYKVSLENPDKMIVFQVIKSSCGFGCVENYSATYKLNLQKLCQKMGDVPKPPDGPWEHNHGDWFCNHTKEWLYNPKDFLYFHVPTSTTIEAKQDEDDEDGMYINFQNDIIAGTFTDKGDNSGVCGNMNRFITWDNLQINTITNCNALCYYSGIFCGHGGSECPEYVIKHLKNNILTVFRESYFRIVDKSKVLSKRKAKKAIEKKSCEVQALELGCIKGFQMTDNNYLDYSRRNNKKDGSTACISLFYGPDEEGLLKLITANVGNSHAILARNGLPIKLSFDHKPNDENERKRIESAGGVVKNVNGTWRVFQNLKNVSNKQYSPSLFISRSFGDYEMKFPQKLVSSEPYISIISIDFDHDDFLVLTSDGVLEFITEQQIVDIIVEKVKKNCSPTESSKAIIDNVRMRGSKDDVTCNIIYLGWKSIFKNNSVEDEHVSENDDEDVDIFK